MNTQPRHPKCRALPVEPHPVIHFSVIIPRWGGKSKIFCLWSFLWSKPLLCYFRQSVEIPQMQVSQGFAAFRLAPSRIPPRHSQMSRATNCTTPGYLLVMIIARNSCDSKFFLSVVIYVVKVVFGSVLLPGKIPQTLVLQGVPGFGCSHRG